MIGQGPSLLLSFATTGLLVDRGWTTRSFTTTAFVAVRAADRKSICMNKAPRERKAAIRLTLPLPNEMSLSREYKLAIGQISNHWRLS